MLSPAPSHVFARILFQENGTFMAMLFPLLSALQLSLVGPQLGQASPSCLISVLAAAAALKDTDLSGFFISVLTNDQINLKYRWKD